MHLVCPLAFGDRDPGCSTTPTFFDDAHPIVESIFKVGIGEKKNPQLKKSVSKNRLRLWAEEGRMIQKIEV
eukprot:m.934964 g.934964  ORF g.934964 m.934964 type:complete len:71 (-) comp23802_c0_seq3:268-480(-)